MAAIAGQFCDFKLIRTRSVVQLVIELPIEQADSALEALGGLPRPAAERWVGIAPLNGPPITVRPAQPDYDPLLDEDGCPNDDGPKDPPRTTPFRDLRPATQAAIKCADRDFQHWLKVANTDEAADLVRMRCRIGTRAELNVSLEAAARWRAMLGQYEDHRLGRH